MTINRLPPGGIRLAIRAGVKRALVSVPVGPLTLLEKVCWGLRFGKWLRAQGAGAVPYFSDRLDLYTYLSQSVLAKVAIDYLEFGVAEGDSIRRWTDLNTNAGSRFFGFDSFRGLPEDWKLAGRAIPRGSFGTGGRTPLIEGDARVRWIVGLFQETLPAFLQDFHPENQLVIHLDADLYSSTLYVLSALNDILGPGAIVIFDEFASFDNEFRALQDFSSAFRRVYGLLAGAGGCYDKVAIQFGGEPRSSAARIGW